MSCLRTVLGVSGRLAVGLFVLFAWYAAVHAQMPSVEFLGERFVKKFADAKNAGDQFAEFGLERETLKDWSKLVTFHHYPQAENDPKRVTANVAKLVRHRHQHADVQRFENLTSGDAMITFYASAPASEIVELNVFRYTRAADGNGLMSAQFSFRFTLGETDADDVKALRSRAVYEMARFPMAAVNAHFGRAPDRPLP